MPRVRGDQSLRLLFLSRLHPKKGIPLLFEGLARARADGVRAELAIAGDGSTAYKEELLALVERLGLRGVVRFLGYLEGESKRAAFASADVYVLPSHQENFGIAVAEALAAGLPVIVTDKVGIAADVREAGAGLVVPVDVAAIAAAVSRLARDPDERRTMSTRAFNLARERYSWERAAREFAELYSGISTGAAVARRA
jgi:glycosyltransferase involved in cell wall biosynthesis